MTLPTVHHHVVDGVPTFWVDSGRPTLGAVLVFRCGIVDETLPTTGWTHLVEHLALHDRERGALTVNGSTSLLRTTVEVHGPADAVTDVLAAVSRWIAVPDLGRIVEESRVLQAEAEFRGRGDAHIAMLQRFGARAAGLAGYSEPGLSLATVELLSEHIRGRFTAGNAALVLDGPPPPGLRLHLPDGPSLALEPPPRSMDPRPAAYPTSGRLVLSGEVPRTHAATLLPAVLERRLREDLRESSGGAYAPWSSYEVVGRDSAVVLAGSGVAQSLLPSLGKEVADMVVALRADPLPAGALDDIVAQVLQSMRDPYQAVGFAFTQAVRALEGMSPESFEETAAQIRAVRRDHIADVVDRWSASLLLGFPADARWEDEVPTLAVPIHRTASDGARFRYGNFPLSREQLVLSEHAIEVGEGMRWQRMRFDEVAGVLAAPDGGRSVIGADGWSIHVEPSMWRGGRQAVELLDVLAPEGRLIPVPARDPANIPRPMPWYRRWWFGAVLWPWTWPLVVVLAVLVVTGLAVSGVVPARSIVTAVVVGAVSIWFNRRPLRGAQGRREGRT